MQNFEKLIEDGKKTSYEKRTNYIKEKLADKLDELERYGKCGWCGDTLPLSDLRREKHFGYLCNHCIKGLESREGPLELIKDI